LGIQLAGILEHLHALSPPVIHRDIKPSNVLLDSAGKAYLIDFGAVREILSPPDGGRTVAGTYGYMPFEQFEGRAAPASDLYSLGATLLFLLSHKAPHQMEAEPGVLDFGPHLNVSEAFADGRQVGSIPGGTDPPQYLAFSPDGTRMAISYDSCQQVTVWSLEGAAIARLNLEPDLLGYRAFTPGSFSPDGSYFAAPARAKNPLSDRPRDQIRIWDTATWRPLGSLTIRSPIKNYLLDSLAFSAEAGRLAAGLGNDFAGEVKLLRFSPER
jgi:serine/threonine protein kinase